MQNQCSASNSIGLIFTRSYRSTLLIMTPTTTPLLVKTSLKGQHYAEICHSFFKDKITSKIYSE